MGKIMVFQVYILWGLVKEFMNDIREGLIVREMVGLVDFCL